MAANSGEFVGVACGDDWTEAATLRDVFNSSGGAFEVSTASCLYRLQYATGYAQGKSEQGSGFWTVEKNIGAGGGTIPVGATGVQFKNAVPGQIATVSARIHRKDEPFLALTFANPQITVANKLDFQHNGILIASEGAVDFEDANGVTWTVADDLPNGRVKISALPATGHGAGISAPAFAVANDNGWHAVTGFNAVQYDTDGYSNLGVNNDRLVIPAAQAGFYAISVWGEWNAQVANAALRITNFGSVIGYCPLLPLVPGGFSANGGAVVTVNLGATSVLQVQAFGQTVGQTVTIGEFTIRRLA